MFNSSFCELCGFSKSSNCFAGIGEVFTRHDCYMKYTRGNIRECVLVSFVNLPEDALDFVPD